MRNGKKPTRKQKIRLGQAGLLGHSDRESLGHYIRLDIENLRECALSFEDGDLI